MLAENILKDTDMSNIFLKVLEFCYSFTGNYGWAIIVFTAFVKIFLLPISLLSQKNSLILYRLQPQLQDIKVYSGIDLKSLLAEQKKLYKKEHYSSFLSLVPLILQLFILFGVIEAINLSVNGNFNFEFLSINLNTIPDFRNLIYIPILSGISSFISCYVQTKLNPLTASQGFIGKWGTTIFLTAFSIWFCFECRAAVGLYWICSNLLNTAVVFLTNAVYNPKKYINEDFYIQKNKITKEEKKAQKARKIREKERESEDMKRFFSVSKELVIFSEASGFYKYFSGTVDYLLENSDITIHYLTADINDQVFAIDHPRLKTYFCSKNGLITTFMKLDCDICLMTTPDLDNFQYKRSIVKKDVEYIYQKHSINSFHIQYKKDAMNNYDTIFGYYEKHIDEIRGLEKLNGSREKRLINVGFPYLDSLIRNYEDSPKAENEKPQILIAPSWQKDNILDLCLAELMDILDHNKYDIIIRPHPEFVKRFPYKIAYIEKKYGEFCTVQKDFSDSKTVYMSDILITDWSGIAPEFAFTTKKPVLYINTPMKVMNPEWESLDILPMDIWLRNELGISLNTDEIEKIENTVQNLLKNKNERSEKITELMNRHLYNVGHSAKASGDYIISRIEEIRRQRENS
jgi:YidC/Oxa1 family membrane protein insertase